MNEQTIRQTLESGQNHPLPLLQHLVNEGDEEGARLVAELGPQYLRSTERLQFRNLVGGLLPEIVEAKNAQNAKRSREQQQQREKSTGEALQERIAAKRARRQDIPLPTGGSWNTPLKGA